MWENNRQPLPDWIQDGYKILLKHINDPREGIPEDQAHQLLLESDEFPNEPDDAEYAIKRLLNRGYFYKVEEHLRVTEPEDHE